MLCYVMFSLQFLAKKLYSFYYFNTHLENLYSIHMKDNETFWMHSNGGAKRQQQTEMVSN